MVAKDNDTSNCSVDVEDGSRIAVLTTVNINEDTYNDRTPENRKLLWKQDIRLMPLTATTFLLCYLDRSNIGNARIMNSEVGNDLETELKMSNEQYTIALMLFLIAYTLFEVPANYFFKKFAPSKWIAFLMMVWGAITVGMGGVQNFAALTGTRFLLGVFEAGLFPGLVYFLTFWYRANERSLRVAIILASSTLAGAFGGAVAYAISHMNRTLGLSAWRWLFILEGIPSCLFSIVIYFYLPNYPESAPWLSAEERELAVERMAYNGSRGASGGMTWKEAKATFMDWRLYAHYLIYLCMSVSFSSLSLFTPSITAGLGYSSLQAQLMTVPPWACAYVVTLTIAVSADRFNARAYHAAAMMTLGAIGFLSSAVLAPDAYSARYGSLIIACCGSFACIPPLLGWLSGNLHSTTAAGVAIALNVSFGAPGQIIGVWVYKASEKQRGYPTGHLVNVAMLLLGAVMILFLRFFYARQNRRIMEEKLDKTIWAL